MQASSMTKDNPYLSESWEQHRDLIEHIVQFSPNILVVVGPSGGGKTTFANFCIKSPGNRLRKFLISAKSLNTKNALSAIAQKLGIVGSDLPVETQMLHDALERKLTDSQQTWVLFIDDADTLPVESLQNIVKFANHAFEQNKRLHLILLGDTSLDKRINNPEFKQITKGSTQLIELEPWTRQDIRAVASRFGDYMRLSEKELAKLHATSKGWPGPFFQAIALRGTSSQSTTQVATKASTSRPSNPKTRKGVQAMSSKKNQRFYTNPVFLGMCMGLVIAGGYLVPHLWDEEEWSELPANAALQVSNTAQDNWLADAKSTLSSALETMPAEEELASVEDGTRAMPLAGRETAANRFGYTNDEERLLLSNSRAYTLELLQDSDAKRAVDFIARHGLNDKASLFRSETEGKNRYVVVYGQYSSASKALNALDNMPDTLQKDKVHPSVRELRGIQEEIRSRKEG